MAGDIHPSILQEVNMAFLCYKLKVPMSVVRNESNRDNELLQIAFHYFELKEQRESKNDN
jgi:hypothetical protein